VNSLKRLFVAISLTIMLCGTALADCQPPKPGEVNGPPCSETQQLTEDPVDQATTATPISNAVEDVILDEFIARLGNLLTVY
jgi:hypothetical protein